MVLGILPGFTLLKVLQMTSYSSRASHAIYMIYWWFHSAFLVRVEDIKGNPSLLLFYIFAIPDRSGSKMHFEKLPEIIEIGKSHFLSHFFHG